jgi:hypothetical protein
MDDVIEEMDAESEESVGVGGRGRREEDDDGGVKDVDIGLVPSGTAVDDIIETWVSCRKSI